MSTPITVPVVKVAMPARERLMPALESVLYSGMVGEGEYVYEFERRFAEHFKLPHMLAMNSGTGALHVALLLAGVKPGDEVITTSMTAEPTNTTVLQVGAVPVFADVEPDTGNIAAADVSNLIGPRTRAIIAVHYAGYPADLGALRLLADKHGIALIEDCAHALGAAWAGNGVGTWGDFAIFSLQAVKQMTTIDGGVLAMRDPRHLAEARRLRWFGMTKGVPRTEVDIQTSGYKYNMHNVAAVIGLHQLDSIAKHLQAHVDNGRYYDLALQSVRTVRPARVPPLSSPTYWIYTLLADDSDRVEKALAAVGVGAAKLHRPNHLHSVFAPYRRPQPALESFYRQLVHIPCGWWVTPDDRARIVDVLRSL